METTGADANDEFARWLAETAKAGQGADPATPAAPVAPAAAPPAALFSPSPRLRRPLRRAARRLAGAARRCSARCDAAAAVRRPACRTARAGVLRRRPARAPADPPVRGSVRGTADLPHVLPAGRAIRRSPPAAAPRRAVPRRRSRRAAPIPPAAGASGRTRSARRRRPLRSAAPAWAPGYAGTGGRRPRPPAPRAQHTLLPAARRGGPRVSAARLPAPTAARLRLPPLRARRASALRLPRLRRRPRTRLPSAPAAAPRVPAARHTGPRAAADAFLPLVPAPDPAAGLGAASSADPFGALFETEAADTAARLAASPPPGIARAAAGGAAGRRASRRRGPAVVALRRPRADRGGARSRRPPTCSRRPLSRPPRPGLHARARVHGCSRVAAARAAALEPRAGVRPGRAAPRPGSGSERRLHAGVRLHAARPTTTRPRAPSSSAEGPGSYEEPPDLDRTTVGEKVAFALAFLVPPVGLIASIVAAAQSARRRGWVHGFVKAALVDLDRDDDRRRHRAARSPTRSFEDQQRHAALEAASAQFCSTVAEQPDMIAPPTFGFPGPGASIPDTVDRHPGVHRSLGRPRRRLAERDPPGRDARRGRRPARSSRRSTRPASSNNEAEHREHDRRRRVDAASPRGPPSTAADLDTPGNRHNLAGAGRGP